MTLSRGAGRIGGSVRSGRGHNPELKLLRRIMEHFKHAFNDLTSDTRVKSCLMEIVFLSWVPDGITMGRLYGVGRALAFFLKEGARG
ncbi:hypothetical protein ACFSCZ_17850 [Siminovitchia sediminis]|uniref:Uncharacterized protein n=1 Tax=Siminovitchia sediminis TaxID=1274353 RepID=A0ABW4KKL5_9BACI